MTNVPTWRRTDTIVAASIFFAFLFISIRYAFDSFLITSDSLQEYTAYLTYVNLGSPWWRPITDSMLSTSLWTTYFPSLLQRLLQLDNPADTYRIALSFLVATTPAMLYVVLRRYAGTIIVLCLVMVFVTTTYYSGYLMYARMHIALTMVLLVIFFLDYKGRQKPFLVGVAIVGLVVSHYTTALLYTVVWIGATTVSTPFGAVALKRLVPSLMVMVVVEYVYYGVLAGASRVLNYFTASISGTVYSLVGWHTPIYPGHNPAVTGATFPVVSVPIPDSVILNPSNIKPAISDAYQPSTTFSLNPFRGERLDFIIGKISILFFAACAVAASVAEIRRGNRHPVLFIALVFSVVSAASIWFPSVASVVGSLRIGFLAMPVYLIVFAMWYTNGSTETTRTWMFYPSLLVGLLFYH